MHSQALINDIIKTLPPLHLVERVIAEKSLRRYTELCWKVIEPKRPLMWGWHLDAICEHLEAVTYGLIKYLIINVPPRHTKSSIVSVMWPTWEWGPANMPWMRYIFSSYGQDLSTRDALRSRRILQSPWYKENWGDIFYLTSDQNQKTRYDNNETGYRIATSVGGLGTGEGGDRIVCDDPHNVRKVESEAIRKDTILWWDETMSNRTNDEETAAFVIIGQRTHKQDLFGHVIEKAEAGDIELTKLILPARYEKRRELNLKTRTPLFFSDPRTEEGEVLDELRYPDIRLRQLESRMSPYAVASQLQQRPYVRGGGFFNVENIKVIEKEPSKKQIVQTIRYWDKAGTQDGGKRTAGVKMHKLRNGRVVISHVRKGQWSAGKREKRMRQTAEIDGVLTHIWIEQEPGSGGKESAQSTVKKLMGFVCRTDRPTGDKFTRAEPFQSAVDEEMVDIVKGPWNEDYIGELEEFGPGADFMDQVDATTGAYNKLHEQVVAGGLRRKKQRR